RFMRLRRGLGQMRYLLIRQRSGRCMGNRISQLSVTTLNEPGMWPTPGYWTSKGGPFVQLPIMIFWEQKDFTAGMATVTMARAPGWDTIGFGLKCFHRTAMYAHSVNGSSLRESFERAIVGHNDGKQRFQE